jgi:2-polyprenyl-3-methyl-5-hydroxy-6-metoxy-1,4-benzoquinol methylase
MHDRHTDKQLYFKEQVYTTEKYVIAFINKAMVVDPGISVLEIGCGEGGNLKPFLDIGCRITGIDLSRSKIDNALKFFSDHPNASKATFIVKDIYLAEKELTEKYDLIIMRDVIEHIHDQMRFMGYVKRFLKPGGKFFIAFPPWYNPFGGHQQVSGSKVLSKLPYYHLLPKSLYKFVLKTGGESAEKIEGFLEIKETGISIERFKKILRVHHYKIILETMYFINPNYQVKFGLKPRKQSALITAIPFFRNFLVTACYYLIEADQ